MLDYNKIANAARKCIKEDGKRSKEGLFRMEFLEDKIAVFEQNKNKSSVYAQMHSSNKVHVVWVIDVSQGFDYKAIGLSFDGERWMFGAANEYHKIGDFEISSSRTMNGLPITIHYDKDRNPKVFEIKTDENVYRLFRVISCVLATPTVKTR